MEINHALWHTLPLDKNKRHFVFGDLHGRYKTFLQLLSDINYDESTDVLYSVGDLIDRGPQSIDVVKFFQRPNCYFARGNHEQMVIDHRRWYTTWMISQNGGPDTIKSMKQHGWMFDDLYDVVNDSPVVIDVGEDSDPDSFRIIHAQSPFSQSEQWLIDHVTNSTDIGTSLLLWGRDDINNIALFGSKAVEQQVHKDYTSRTMFHGHTPTVDVVTANNSYWIDTYGSDTTTCMNAITREIFTTQQQI